jgi:lipase maturation factor 1
VAEKYRSTYALGGWLFIRLLCLSYLFAFWSLAQQVQGLIGQDGILPAREYMANVVAAANSQHIGWDRFHLVPTLFWLSTSDAFLRGLCVGGALLAAFAVAGAAPALVLPLLWVAYLSLVVVCRDFLSYQWDALLLETGLLAIPVARLTLWDSLGRAADPPRVARWLLWWLLFRLMFGSGLVKIASGDPTWRDFTALAVHYETQPLPTPFAWYASQLPLWFHKLSTAVVLGVELVVPWLIFVSRRPRAVAATMLVGLQCLIAVTGNYAFFNLISVALCLTLLDDSMLRRLAPAFMGSASTSPARAQHSGARRIVASAFVRWPMVAAAILAAVTIPVSLVTLTGQMGLTLPASTLVYPLMRAVEPVQSVNPYGLFAVMTTTRSEIIVEGSNDGVTWEPYQFTDKVGDERRSPGWVAPFQPRLDWQMWFAALSEYEREAWFQRFSARLLRGSPSVLKLLARDPFGGKPPQYLRSTLYQYRFAGATAHFRAGEWWTRERIGPYSPVLSLPRPTDK